MVMPQDLSIVRREEYCSDNEFSPVRVMQIELAGPSGIIKSGSWAGFMASRSVPA